MTSPVISYINAFVPVFTNISSNSIPAGTQPITIQFTLPNNGNIDISLLSGVASITGFLAQYADTDHELSMLEISVGNVEIDYSQADKKYEATYNITINMRDQHNNHPVVGIVNSLLVVSHNLNIAYTTDPIV